MIKPLVTAIVSTYTAERFIRGCMNDLIAQTIFDKIEIIVIDSGSPENEHLIVKEYVDQYPEQVRLIRTERESLYAAWNRAVGLARGQYLTNANTDDRHRHDAFELLANILDSNPKVGLVYADQWVSETENETFDECEARNAKRSRWPDFTHRGMMIGCIPGSQPMWRRELHHELGLFNIKYNIVADYEMWLRVASKHEILKLDDVCGVFFTSPNTISGRANRWIMNKENFDVQRHYVRQQPWSNIKNIGKELAKGVFSRGYMHIEQNNDEKSAEPYILEAIKLDPFNINYIKTYLYRCVALRAIKMIKS